TAGEGSEEPTEEEETSTEAAEPAGATASTYVWAGVIVFALLLLAAIPAIWRSILRSRRTKDPNDLEAVWTEVRALATDYGQSLDPSGTLRFNELILSGIAPTTAAPAGTTAGTAAQGPTTAQPRGGAATAGGPSAHAVDRLRRLRSPAPTGPETQSADTALSAFIDALEAQRYGAATESLDSSEVQTLIDEVGTDLSERATPGSRISAKIWPASLFNPPR